MWLANQLTYDDKLKCVSEQVSNAQLKLNADYKDKIKSVKLKQILTSAVVLIDTSPIVLSSASCQNGVDKESHEGRTVNSLEVSIVSTMCRVLREKSDCNAPHDIGIIAPYNNQVRELQKAFATKAFYKDIEINTVDQFQG